MKHIYLLLLLFIFKALCAENNKQLEKIFYLYLDSTISESSSKKSLYYSFKLLEYGTKINEPEKKAYAYLNISHSYTRSGNYSDALDYAVKSAKIYNDLQLIDHLASTYNLIGTIYLSIPNYKLSIEYLKKALIIHQKGNRIELMGDDMNNIGEAFRLQNEIDSARYYFQWAYENFNLYAQDKNRIAYTQCNLGLVYLLDGDLNKSDSILKLSFSYLKSVGDSYPECIAYYEKAKLQFKKGNYKASEKNALHAYKLALNNNYINEITKILQLLSNVSNKNSNLNNAYQYLSLYHQYQDTILSNKVVSQMSEMRAEFEISQNEKELNFLKNLSQLRAKLLSVALAGLLAIATLSLFLLRVNKKRKEANYLLSEYNEELKQKNQIINQSLIEKEMLMKEIHHRVKNNLQIISSIINLQSMRIKNKDTLEIFSEMQRRIMAISSIHQKLYQGDSVSFINMKDYLEEIVESIHNAFNNNNLSISYEIAVQNVKLSIDVAVAIGLIVNELTTNAYKYAFASNNENLFIITLVKNIDKTIELTIQDSGPGIKKEIDFANTDSLGLRMVNLLTRQQKGNIVYKNENGSRFELVFNQLD